MFGSGVERRTCHSSFELVSWTVCTWQSCQSRSDVVNASSRTSVAGAKTANSESRCHRKVFHIAPWTERRRSGSGPAVAARFDWRGFVSNEWLDDCMMKMVLGSRTGRWAAKAVQAR